MGVPALENNYFTSVFAYDEVSGEQYEKGLTEEKRL
jgi:hypothetical protein